MSSKKMSVYGLRGITHFGAKIYNYHFGSFSGRAKVMLFTLSGFKRTKHLRRGAACQRKSLPGKIYSFGVKAVPKFLCSLSLQAFTLTVASDLSHCAIYHTDQPFEITHSYMYKTATAKYNVKDL